MTAEEKLNKIAEIISRKNGIEDSQEFGLSYGQMVNYWNEIEDVINNTPNTDSDISDNECKSEEMTPQEAIEIMDIAIAEVEWNYPMSYAIAFEKAKEALNRISNKEPIKVKNEIVCPYCRTLVGSSPCCRYCGQALDHKNVNNLLNKSEE
jgi:hypothetical protein